VLDVRNSEVRTSDFSGNTVSVIDVSTNKVKATITVGDAPFAFGQFIGPDKER
jgi:YVTN family beta-propeller protein